MPFVVSALVALQLASQTPAPSAPPDAEPTSARRLDFGEVDVRGQLQAPTGTVLWGKPVVHKRNLIELRKNFRPQLLGSRDAL